MGGDEGAELDAGLFGGWMADTLAVLRDGADADVPCDGCTACCESSQFVLVEPDEHDARRAIPADLLFPAPGAPAGYSLLPYDEHGRCPMLVDGGCSIYEHRPRTCRAYDCRVLAAAGIDPGPEKPSIRARVSQWRFRFPDDADQRAAAATLTAATFLAEHSDDISGGTLPPTQRAALAVEVHELFRDGTPTVAEVLVELRRLSPR